MAPASTPAGGATPKIIYIDRLRVILTALVVLHHVLVTYGAPGFWYFTQKATREWEVIPMILLVTVNQSFFMGFFFFLSAYFIGPSLKRKGSSRFIADRLTRLGIPLLFYSFILSPFLNYLVYYFGKGRHIGFLQYLRGYDDWIDFGVLWFVAALLLFTLLYLLWRALSKRSGVIKLDMPSPLMIIIFAAGVGVASFLVRIWFPVGWSLPYTGFQLAYFSQYIALFVLGLAASQNDWLNTLDWETGKRFIRYALRLLWFFLLFFILEKLIAFPASWFTNGFHWQQFLFAVWEQTLGFSIIVGLLAYARKYWNQVSAGARKLSRYVFAVYIFHPLVIISLTLAVKDLPVDPGIKLLIVAPLAIAGSFALAYIILRIPGVKRII